MELNQTNNKRRMNYRVVAQLKIHMVDFIFNAFQRSNCSKGLTRPVTGKSLRIYRLFTQKGFEIGVDKEQSNTRNLIETS